MFACVNVNAYFLKKFWYAVLYAGSFERWTSIVSGTTSGHVIVLQVMSMAYTRHSHIISTAQFTKSIMTISTRCPMHWPWHDSHTCCGGGIHSLSIVVIPEMYITDLPMLCNTTHIENMVSYQSKPANQSACLHEARMEDYFESWIRK